MFSQPARAYSSPATGLSVALSKVVVVQAAGGRGGEACKGDKNGMFPSRHVMRCGREGVRGTCRWCHEKGEGGGGAV